MVETDGWEGKRVEDERNQGPPGKKGHEAARGKAS
jgi:hypothetical protein